jgi:hypothetical protein
MHDLNSIFSVIIGVYFFLSVLGFLVGVCGLRKKSDPLGHNFSRRQVAGTIAVSGLFLPMVSVLSGTLAFMWRKEV